ncbi:MAG: NAD(P)-binding domain-containing protein [Saprospiraceae bacterium]|nr:NAD(P)-binding domain-containing protein [Saprospiraceae bacterium]HMW39366.1 NAD(P)-binding domain-containing protein [Saprospiraceae bacterium]HMX88415.1 NAD(P)-binding domain-containing protein [Saprospiraceae bacterium]HMZ39057.1 NAD(P)-binding domain-containing protein [Saprospiraceae bacterium]HNA63397.1 NAD(P)-binding domain-containing protein [Saprospiraceae bacterium]
MKIGILGSGVVGVTLANGFIKKNYSVMIGTNSVEKIQDLRTKTGMNAAVGNFEETAAWADLIVLATKGNGSVQALKLCRASDLNGKTIIDTTNPIADAPPEDGVLRFYTDLHHSQMEILQNNFPDAHFVKAFNSVGSALMVDPDLAGGKPTMFICGNNPDSKLQVSEILEMFGWEPQDMGSVKAARAIEPLCMLWCIRGFRDNQWMHAFKLLKQ